MPHRYHYLNYAFYIFKLINFPPFFVDEHELIDRIRKVAKKNEIWRSYIGMGYHNCYVPHPILRNMFENPGWYD